MNESDLQPKWSNTIIVFTVHAAAWGTMSAKSELWWAGSDRITKVVTWDAHAHLVTCHHCTWGKVGWTDKLNFSTINAAFRASGEDPF